MQQRIYSIQREIFISLCSICLLLINTIFKAEKQNDREREITKQDITDFIVFTLIYSAIRAEDGQDSKNRFVRITSHSIFD